MNTRPIKIGRWGRPKVAWTPADPGPEPATPGPAHPGSECLETPGRSPHSPTPRHGDPQAPRSQASGGWRQRRGPPTWPPVAASGPRPPPITPPGPAAPWRPPWRRGGGGGAAGLVVAGSGASRRLLVALSLRVWRRRLPPARSSLRPATRTLTPDPGGGKRAAIQNQCSFIGSGDGHYHCPARPVLPAKTPAAHARPSRQPRERALPTALARTSAPRPRAVLGSRKREPDAGVGAGAWR